MLTPLILTTIDWIQDIVIKKCHRIEIKAYLNMLILQVYKEDHLLAW